MKRSLTNFMPLIAFAPAGEDGAAPVEDDALATAKANLDAAELAVTVAEDTTKTLRGSTKQLKLDVTEARKNLKAAEAYYKGIAGKEETTPEDLKTGEEGVTGWKAALDTREAAVEENKKAIAEAVENVKAAKAARTEAKKAVTATKKTVTKPKVERVTQNGQIQPLPGSVSGDLWDVFDTVKAELGTEPAIGDVFERARAARNPLISAGTTKSAYAHWRKFHGVTGRVFSQDQLKAQQEKEAAAKAKAEEKEAKAKAKAEEAAAKAAEAAAAAEAKAAAESEAA